MWSSKGGCLASPQASGYMRITSVVMFSSTYVVTNPVFRYVFTDYVLKYSYIHCCSLLMCSCASTDDKCFSGRHDTLTLVFDITHSGRRSTLTCRGLAFFSARLPPPSGEIRIRGKSKHLKGRLGPRVSNVTFFNHGGQLGPRVSNVSFF